MGIVKRLLPDRRWPSWSRCWVPWTSSGGWVTMFVLWVNFKDGEERIFTVWIISNASSEDKKIITDLQEVKVGCSPAHFSMSKKFMSIIISKELANKWSNTSNTTVMCYMDTPSSWLLMGTNCSGFRLDTPLLPMLHFTKHHAHPLKCWLWNCKKCFAHAMLRRIESRHCTLNSLSVADHR